MASSDLTPQQQDILVRTVLGEAANQGQQGMAAVAAVIKNRADSGQFGASDPATIALQHNDNGVYQFSANAAPGVYGGNNVGRNANPNSPVYQQALAAVNGVFDGTLQDPTGGATFYHNGSVNPSWDKNMHRTAQIGAHTFFSPAPPVNHYDAAGNLIQPQAPQQPVPLALLPAPKANAPATVPASSPDDDALLAKYLGGAQTPQQPAAAASSTPASSEDDALLAKYLGTATNLFGTTAKPGTPEYAAAAVAAVKNGQPLPAADPTHHPDIAAPQQDVVPGWMRAFSENAVNNVPVLGPGMHALRNALMGPDGGAQMDALGQSASAANPVAAGAGSVFGTVAPFVFVGPETMAGKALGMAGDYGAGAGGNVLARAGAGSLSGAVLSGADTAARGGDLGQVGQNMLTGGVIGGVAAPAAHAVGEVVGKGVNAFFGKSAPQAIAGAMKEDQLAPGQINQLIQARGPAATAADLGPNMESLAGGLASLPGKPKAIVVNNLTARAAGAGDRLNADIAANLGTGQPVGALTDQITAQQKAAADPLYAAVRQQPVQVSPDLADLMKTPIGQRAFKKAAEWSANDGLQPAPTVGFFDYMKQAIDDEVSAAQRAGEGNASRQAASKAGDITNAIDMQLGGAPGKGAYADARNAYAGPAKVKDAIEQGQSAFSKSTTPEEMQRQLAGMSTSERDGFLAGAQDAVQNIVRNARSDAQGAKTAFQSSNAKEKLASLIGPDAAQAISEALDREAQYTSTTGNAVHNSKSAARLAQQKVVSPDAAAIPNKLIGNQTAWGTLLGAFDQSRKALTGWYRNAQNVRMANMLTSGALSPADAAAVARAGSPRGTSFPGAAVPLLAKDNNINLPGSNPLLQWAQPDNALLGPGPGGLNGPLKIVVRGATVQ